MSRRPSDATRIANEVASGDSPVGIPARDAMVLRHYPHRPPSGYAAWRLIQRCLDTVYPPRCVVLGCGARGRWLCRECEAEVVRDAARCPVCGRRGEAAIACRACTSMPSAVRRTYCGGAYEGVLRQAIHALKYGGVAGVARPLADLAWGARPAERPLAADLASARGVIVVPVPGHPSRAALRWVDHAGLLALWVGRDAGVPVAPRMLVRHRRTRPQFGLAPKERHANVDGAFRVMGDPSGAGVLLVDDVMTSCATARACADALAQAGAAWIDVYVVARADP